MGSLSRVKVTLSYYVASQHIQELLEAILILNHKNAVFDREQKKKEKKKKEKRIDYSCEDRIEKSITCDHHLSSLGKTRDTNR